MNTTTTTFTFNKYNTDIDHNVAWEQFSTQPGYIASQEFQRTHGLRGDTVYATNLDMAGAFVAQTKPHIISTVCSTNGEEDSITYTVSTRWAVFANDANGEQCIAVSRGVHSQYAFDTEAEAAKFMKKLQKSAAKWNAEEDARNNNANAARAALAADPMFTPCGWEIDPSNAIGAQVRIRQMGKQRVGVIVDQTASKWVVVYTTPSNPTEIRTTKVAKGK